jgi:hypothetical protein
MRRRIEIENIEEIRRREGIDDVELREEVRRLAAGDLVRLSLLTGPTTFETLTVRITSVHGSAFRGKLTSPPTAKCLADLHAGYAITFTADHIHSLAKGRDPREQ